MAAAGMLPVPENARTGAQEPTLAKASKPATEPESEAESPTETARIVDPSIDETAPAPELNVASEPVAPLSKPAAPAAPAARTSVDEAPATPAEEPAISPAAARTPASAQVRETGYVPRHPGVAPPHRRKTRRLPESLKPLINAIASGRERVVLVSGLGDPAFSAGIIEQIGAACSALGLGVASIDAASGRTGNTAGLGDLLAGAASFGDVVHSGGDGHIARVPWGRKDKLDARSSQGVTLAEALSDIYNVVLISTGLPGPGSSLPVFAGLDGYVVLASTLPVDEAALAGFEAGAGALGFKRVQVVSEASGDMQVA